MSALDSVEEAQVLSGGEGTSASPSPQTDRFTLGTLGLSSASRLSVVDVTVAAGSLVSDGGEEVDCCGPMISNGLPVVGGSLCWARAALAPAPPHRWRLCRWCQSTTLGVGRAMATCRTPPSASPPRLRPALAPRSVLAAWASWLPTSVSSNTFSGVVGGSVQGCGAFRVGCEVSCSTAR